jgi:hypothetical protein
MDVVFAEVKSCFARSNVLAGELSWQRAQKLLRHLYRTFMAVVFLQPPQNIATEFSIHGLFWWNKFLMHESFSVKKTNVDLALF